jgi:hypothetical protein
VNFDIGPMTSIDIRPLSLTVISDPKYLGLTINFNTRQTRVKDYGVFMIVLDPR